MVDFGVEENFIFTDKQSGKDFDRPAYQTLLGLIGAGDTLVVNIKTLHLIQSQTRVQTSEVLATRAFEVFCCSADALFCQRARVAQKPPLYGVGANGCI